MVLFSKSHNFFLSDNVSFPLVIKVFNLWSLDSAVLYRSVLSPLVLEFLSSGELVAGVAGGKGGWGEMGDWLNATFV